MPIERLLPWTDRTGRFSWPRAAALAAAVSPGLWLGHAFFAGQLAAEPFKQTTHLTGAWTLYFLLASLAVTPLRRLLAWPGLIGIRRILGVTAFGYAAAHLALYVLDHNGDLLRVAGEIASRVYLTIGFAAVLGLAVLAATSFDAAIRRLGRNWKRLHWIVYPLTALGLAHFFLQSRSDVSEPVLLSAVFFGLLLHRSRRLPRGMAGVVAAALLAGLAVAGIEFAWYATMSGIPAGRVLAANLDFGFRIAPMWLALAICAGPLPAMLARRAMSGFREARLGRSEQASCYRPAGAPRSRPE